ncbi:hypothetical protein [Corallococcus coralloides]|nr:hypothetical protein [Corallococcus coralloides]
MTFTTDEWTCTSKGRKPDQAMMIVLAMVGLLDGVRILLTSSETEHRFIGVDSSFSVWFRKSSQGKLSLTCGATSLGQVESKALCQALLSGVDEFLSRPESALPEGDAARGDLTAALNEFRQAFPKR